MPIPEFTPPQTVSVDAWENSGSLLVSWGEWQRGTGGLKDPLSTLKAAAGISGEQRADYAGLLLVASYVESTWMFESMRPILRWVYVLGKRIEVYPFRRPMESYDSALFRHGYIVVAGECSELTAPIMALWRFRIELACRYESDPPPKLDWSVLGQEELLWKTATHGELVQRSTAKKLHAAIEDRDWNRARRLLKNLERLKRATAGGDRRQIAEATRRAEETT